MSGVVFLLVAGGLSLAGSLVLWLRSREPTSWESGIEEHSARMRALSLDDGPPDDGGRRRQR